MKKLLWKIFPKNKEEWEFTPTICPTCGGDIEIEEFEEL